MQGALLSTTIAFGLIACSGPGVSPPAPDAPSGAGIAILWTTSPDVPGQVGSNVWISSMVFRVASLRVVGDTGTSDSSITLSWGSGGPPPPAEFSDAPSGLYSKIDFHADGMQLAYSWEIDGTVALGAAPQPFAIHDLMDLDAQIDTSAMLAPGGSATLGVTFQIDQAFAGLDFSQFEVNGSTLVLDTDDDQMSAFRVKLQQAIGATGVD